MKIAVYDINGNKKKEIDFKMKEIKVSDRKISQVLRAYITNIHQGTKSAKTRGQIKHPDRKLWKQKGTGRARMGSRNSPIWVGGGVAHGPKSYQKRLQVNKKEQRQVFEYLLNEIVKTKRLVVIEDVDTKLKTKEVESLLTKLNLLHQKIMAVFDIKDVYMHKAFRNLKNVLIRRAQLLSPFDLNRGRPLLITESAWNILIKRLD